MKHLVFLIILLETKSACVYAQYLNNNNLQNIVSVVLHQYSDHSWNDDVPHEFEDNSFLSSREYKKYVDTQIDPKLDLLYLHEKLANQNFGGSPQYPQTGEEYHFNRNFMFGEAKKPYFQNLQSESKRTYQINSNQRQFVPQYQPLDGFKPYDHHYTRPHQPKYQKTHNRQPYMFVRKDRKPKNLKESSILQNKNVIPFKGEILLHSTRVGNVSTSKLPEEANIPSSEFFKTKKNDLHVAPMSPLVFLAGKTYENATTTLLRSKTEADLNMTKNFPASDLLATENILTSELRMTENVSFSEFFTKKKTHLDFDLSSLLNQKMTDQLVSEKFVAENTTAPMLIETQELYTTTQGVLIRTEDSETNAFASDIPLHQNFSEKSVFPTEDFQNESRRTQSPGTETTDKSFSAIDILMTKELTPSTFSPFIGETAQTVLPEEVVKMNSLKIESIPSNVIDVESNISVSFSTTPQIEVLNDLTLTKDFAPAPQIITVSETTSSPLGEINLITSVTDVPELKPPTTIKNLVLIKPNKKNDFNLNSSPPYIPTNVSNIITPKPNIHFKKSKPLRISASGNNTTNSKLKKQMLHLSDTSTPRTKPQTTSTSRAIASRFLGMNVAEIYTFTGNSKNSQNRNKNSNSNTERIKTKERNIEMTLNISNSSVNTTSKVNQSVEIR